MHKPYYFLYFSQVFFCHKFLGFLCISCKGCPQTILFLVRNRWSRYLPGSFRMGEQLDCSFYFMSCLCRYMVGLHTFASFVLHRSACGSRPSAQTFLQTFCASHATGRQFHIKRDRNSSTSGIIRNGQSPRASNMFSYVALDLVEFRGVFPGFLSGLS